MLVTLWMQMDAVALTLMNVQLIPMAVLKTVKTRSVPTPVAAMLATVSMLMDTLVMVSNYCFVVAIHIYCYNV